MKIEYLNWDSNFFNLKIGKLKLEEDALFNPLLFRENAEDENYDLIYVYKINKMLTKTELFNSNLSLVDIQIAISQKFDKRIFSRESYEFKTSLTTAERLECYEIAESISKVSRFSKENILSEQKIKDLYRCWIDNTINKSYCDGLLFVKDKITDTILGLLTIKIDTEIGYCSLVGVRPDVKGKGVGRLLWNQTFGYFAQETNVDRVEVQFSLENLASFNFHLKMGFNNIIETNFVYHYTK